MKLKREAFGLKLEIIGLCFLFAATIWQALVSDWFDNFPIKSQAYSQAVANQAILNSIHQISLALSATNQDTKNALLRGAQSVTANAQMKLETLDANSEKLAENQTKPLNIFRLFLFIVGTLFIIVGKCHVYRVKSLDHVD